MKLDVPLADEVVAEVVETWIMRFLNSGVLFSDLVEILRRVRGWPDWLGAWREVADRYLAHARRWEAEGRHASAAGLYELAAVYYHYGYFVWTVDREAHRQALLAMVAAHEKALPHMRPAVRKMRIPWEGRELTALLSVPETAGKRPAPVVIVLPGLDSCKETRHQGRGAYLRRGLAVLSLDGPGQGESFLHSTIRPDYETAVRAAIDALQGVEGVDANRVAVVGMSLGGYYAARAAAFEGRLSAAVVDSGPYDLGEAWPQLPRVTREAFQLYSGASSPEEARRRAGELHLRGVAARIRIPTLILHGEQDPLFGADHARRLAEEIGSAATLQVFPEGNHGLQNVRPLVAPMVADWVADRLRAGA
ncbi:MAG TPA: alpha/beta fold hydrolase [Limnochordales bacterium]